MCGIVGFTGDMQAAPILLDGLSKLEYRGYDSAGIAVRDGEKETDPYLEHVVSDIQDGRLMESHLRQMHIRTSVMMAML